MSSKQFQALFDVLYSQVTLTDATIAAQVAGQVSLTVPGAQKGDFVLVSYPADLAGIIISGQVSATDTVKITTFNVEGTDAVTAMSGGLTANIIVLHPKVSG
jgi:hypothetical protein